VLKFRRSSFDHGIAKEQMQAVLADRWQMTKWFAIHDDRKGNSQDMAVGFDAEGCLLEIGISYVDDDEIVFHADKVSPNWKNKYNEK
jgi:hypothetical protein